MPPTVPCATLSTGAGHWAQTLIWSRIPKPKEEIAAYAKDPYTYYKQFGYSANAMPTLPLEDEEFRDVADYISSLQPFKKWMIKKKD